MHYLGMMADVIFIGCSAWFLVDDDRVNGKKIAYFLGDKYVITILFIVLAIVMGYSVSAKGILSALIPGSLWFVMCYVLYYAFHPCLNAVIKALDKNKLLMLNVVLIILYSVYTFLLRTNDYYCRLIGYFVIYFVIAYVKKHMHGFTKSLKVNVFMLIVGLLGQIGLLMISDFVGVRVSRLSDEMLRWDTLINPFSIIIAIAAINIANKGQFINRTINYLSSLSLLVYMLHANNFARTVILPDVMSKLIHSLELGVILSIVLTSVILIIGAVVLSILYKYTIQKIAYKLCDLIACFIGKIYKLFEKLAMKVN